MTGSGEGGGYDVLDVYVVHNIGVLCRANHDGTAVHFFSRTISTFNHRVRSRYDRCRI